MTPQQFSAPDGAVADAKSGSAELRSPAQSASLKTAWSRTVIVLNVVIGVYWAIMFVATHAPIPQVVLEFELWDKLEHFCAYGLLGLLLSLRRVAAGSWGRSAAVNILLITGTYGVVDEVTQIAVGRQCDLVDWIADMCGVLAAIGFVAVCRVMIGASSNSERMARN